MDWQPIESAPINGDAVLLWLDPPLDTSYAVGWSAPGKLNVVVGWADDGYRDGPVWRCGFCEEGSADTDGYSSALQIEVEPTYWRPLPAPPA